MLVFWQQRLVFLAVPKTGTTAIEGALAPRAALVFRDPPILKHTPVYRYHRLVEPFLKKAGDVELETFAIVRNPISWLGSWYRYRSRDDLVGHENSTRGVSFDEFVNEYAKGKPAPFAHVGSQAKFLTGPDGDMRANYLFQYESPGPFFDFLNERLGFEGELPRLNVSPDGEVSLSEKTEDKLRRKCAAEFDLWESAIKA